jgi:hypothetical protein
MAGALTKYNAARRALAAANRVDEVKDIRDKAVAMQAYAQQAKDTELIGYATEIRLRAERRAGELLRDMGERGERDTGKGNRNPTLKSQAAIPKLSDLGISPTQSSRWQRLADVELTEFETKVEAAKRKTISAVNGAGHKILSQIDRDERRARSRNAPVLADGIDLRIGDCRLVLADVPNNSVALVLTDPPYGDESAPLYEWLAAWSARVLIPGGSLVCYTGHSRLDRDMAILGSRLRYWWLLAMLHDQSQRLPGKFVIVNFKPVLWYVKETRRGRTLMPDILRSPARDKDLHNWSQGDGGVSQIIEHLTEPNELVADPFAGTAKWGQICAGMGRQWVGADVVNGGASVVEAA